MSSEANSKARFIRPAPLARLKEARSLSVKALARASHRRLARLIKAAGYFNVKARRLKNFISFVETRYGGSIKKMSRQNLELLRAELLSINGTGPETADSILLYAAGFASVLEEIG